MTTLPTNSQTPKSDPPWADILSHCKTALTGKKLSLTSRKLYLADIKRFLAWLPSSNLTPSSLSSPDLYQDHLKNLETQGLSPSMLKRTTASLRQLGHIVDDLYNLGNPTLSLSISSPKPRTNYQELATSKYLKHFTNYLRLSHLSPSTIKSYKSDVSRYLTWADQHLPSTKIDRVLTDKSIKKYLNYLAKSVEHPESTRTRKRASLTRFQSWYLEAYGERKAPDNTPSSGKGLSLTGIPDCKSRRARQPAKGQSLQGIFPILSFSLIALLTLGLAYFGYQAFSRDQVLLSQAYPSSPISPNRQLSFQGRLEDSGGTPITSSTNLVFKLFDASTVGTELYSTGTCVVVPDTDGVFSTQIGGDCGSGIGSSVFSENPDVYLEVTVGAETLTPRQQIATVAYALNSETLQGIPLSSTMSAIANSIVPMNSYGEIIIGEQSPRMTGVSGTFAISAPALSLTTTTGSSGNISIAPDGTGQVNITGNTTSTNFFNVSNAQLTTGSLITGTVANSNTGYKLLDLLSGTSPTSVFSVDDAGLTTIGADLYANSGISTFGTATSDGTIEATQFCTGDGETNCVTDFSSLTSGASIWTDAGVITHLTSETDDLTLGGTTSSSPFFFDESAELLTLTNTTAGDSFRVNDTTSDTTPFIIDADGNVGIGTTAPGSKLHVYGTSGELATFGADAHADQYIIVRDNSTYGSMFGYEDTLNGTLIQSGLSKNIAFNVNSGTYGSGTNAMFIESTGNIGIGTTAPQSLLDVQGGAGAAGILTLASQELTVVDGDKLGQINFNAPLESDGTDSILVGASIWAEADDTFSTTVNSTELVFGTNTTGTATEKMRIDSAGKVGIGTATPVAKLDVWQSGGAGGDLLHLRDNTDAKDLYIRYDGTNAFEFWTESGGTGTNILTLEETTGNVGIGTTAPDHKINVDSTDTTTGFNNGVFSFRATSNYGGLSRILFHRQDNNSIVINEDSVDLDFRIEGDTDGNLFKTDAGYNSVGIGGAPGTGKLYVNGNVGINTTAPQSLLDVQGGAGAAGILTLASQELTVVDGDVLGQINFNAPLESDGTDAILVGASIWAEADDIFSTTVNSTELVFATGTSATATEKMRIDSSGNVGIGTDSPQSNLHIKQATGDAELRIQSGGADGDISWLRFQNSTDNDNFAGGISSIRNSGLDHDLAFYTWGNPTGTERMRILNNGNVGIGTTDPVTGLHVFAGSSGESFTNLYGLAIESSGTSNSYHALQVATGVGTVFDITNAGNVGIGTTAPDKTLHVYNSSINTVARFQSGDNQVGFLLTDDAGTTSFYRDSDAGGFFIDATGGGTADLFIKNDGNVGIGTTGPNQALEVNGKIAIGDSGDGIILQKTSGLSSIIGIDTSSSAYNDLELRTTSGTQLYLDTSGNVGIGTTTPGAKLEVYETGANATFNLSRDSGATIQGIASTTWASLGTTAGQTFSLRSNGTDRILLDTNGDISFNSGDVFFENSTNNVGIGTTSPGAKLEVYGSSGTFFDVQDDGSSVFSVSDTAVTSNLPTSFTSAGDVAIAYDLVFTNPTASYIQSSAPLYLQAGESYASSDLTLSTYNAGDIILDAGDASGDTGTIQFYDSYVKAATITTPIAFSDSATDINTYRSNFTDETLIGAINETYLAVTGGGGGLWTRSGTDTYLTNTGDNVGIGTTSPNALLDVSANTAATILTSSTDGSLAAGEIIGKFGFYKTDASTGGAGTPTYIQSRAYDLGGLFEMDFITGSISAPVTTMTLGRTGNVGIGTTSPLELLDVHSSGFSELAISSDRNTDGQGTSGLRFYGRNDAGTPENIIYGSINNLMDDVSDGTEDGSLLFYTMENGTLTEQVRIDDSGNVGIGTTAPGEKLEVNGNVAANIFYDTAGSTYYLDPAATGTSLIVDGNIVSDGAYSITSNGTNGNITLDAGTGTVVVGSSGTGKLDVGTIDPPYSINGDKFATYLSGMTGVKEETTGTVNTSEHIPGHGYRTTLNLASATQGSDLWLFREITNLHAQFDQLIVLLSSATNTRTWYNLHPDSGIIEIYSSQPSTISYRLTAPRFDADTWANARDSESLGFVLDGQPNWDPTTTTPPPTLSDTFTEIFHSLTTSIAQVTSLETNLISPLDTSQPLTISTNTVITPTLDSSPALTVEGEISTDIISAREARFTHITTNRLYADEIVAGKITADVIEGLDAKIASLSAGSTAELSDDDLETITDRIKARLADLSGATAENISTPPEATPSRGDPLRSPTLPETPIASDSATLASLDADMVFINDYLAVIGSAVMTNLDITGLFYTDSIISKSNTLSLQPNGGLIRMANNTLIVDSTGQVMINGDLSVSGKILASSANLGSLELGTPPATPSSQLGQLLSVYNESGKAVATIDASGSASFRDLSTQLITIASPSNSTQSASTSALATTMGTTSTSNATAGNSSLITPNTEVHIESEYITPNTLVYLTPTTNTDNKVLFVAAKETCLTPLDESEANYPTGALPCTRSFTVAIDSPASTDIDFNWWVIQLEAQP